MSQEKDLSSVRIYSPGHCLLRRLERKPRNYFWGLGFVCLHCTVTTALGDLFSQPKTRLTDTSKHWNHSSHTDAKPNRRIYKLVHQRMHTVPVVTVVTEKCHGLFYLITAQKKKNETVFRANFWPSLCGGKTETVLPLGKQSKQQMLDCSPGAPRMWHAPEVMKCAATVVVFANISDEDGVHVLFCGLLTLIWLPESSNWWCLTHYTIFTYIHTGIIQFWWAKSKVPTSQTEALS